MLGSFALESTQGCCAAGTCLPRWLSTARYRLLGAGEDGAIDEQDGPAAPEEMILHTTQPLTQDGRGTGGADQSDVQAAALEGSQDVDIGGTVSPKRIQMLLVEGLVRCSRLPGMLCWFVTSP